MDLRLDNFLKPLPAGWHPGVLQRHGTRRRSIRAVMILHFQSLGVDSPQLAAL
jgi:hypothetical protein